MLTGAHTVIYSTDPEADRSFLRDVLKARAADRGAKAAGGIDWHSVIATKL